ncbi:hypothetical protein [Pyxidicoccus caerfyrddinensis]|uniref:hypothetical protein n=1 Tax=Pyxidicoccus caerfyrddinensis TaxID=2709663 RepID=UPI0013DA204A|nr:hypothetical protein [Pyxidicoccus caerfyrddinensis]
MPGTHSLDLRKRIIAAWQQGEGKSAIARRFIPGYATARRDIGRFDACGSVSARPYGESPGTLISVPFSSSTDEMN